MGFFDSKSRRLRDKMSDLRQKLEAARREGNFICQDGVYFASLEEMGEESMMLMAADLHSDFETDVIREFLGRNGFTVEELKLDASGGKIARIEVVPSNEIIMAMAMLMQGEKYRVIDDSEAEQAFNVMAQICPLSALARAISFHFIRRVEQIILDTPVKMTREGNRLLSWLPQIVDALGKAADPNAIQATERHFEDAFQHFYAMRSNPQAGEKSQLQMRFEKGGQFGDGMIEQLFAEAMAADSAALQKREAAAAKQPAAEPRPARVASAPQPEIPDDYAPLAFDMPADSTATPRDPAAAGTSVASSDSELQALRAEAGMRRTLAHLYRALIGRTPAEAAENAGRLLTLILGHFGGSAACLLAPSADRKGLVVAAGAGAPVVWGAAEGSGALALPAALIKQCGKSRQALAAPIEDPAAPRAQRAFALITPLVKAEQVLGLIYLERTEASFSPDDAKSLTRFTHVFTEFPRLTQAP